MIIHRSTCFTDNLTSILAYIALDSKGKAKQFKNALQSSIRNIPYLPYKFKKSIYFDDENIRDYIFMGYCIPYLVNEEKNTIVLLDIIKWREK